MTKRLDDMTWFDRILDKLRRREIFDCDFCSYSTTDFHKMSIHILEEHNARPDGWPRDKKDK